MEKQTIIKQQDTKSIRYPQSIDDKIEKMATSFKRSKKELFCQMVDYFYRSKKDPDDPGDELLKRQLSSGISRILSFIKQQEKDFLLPVFTEMDVLKSLASKQASQQEIIVKHLIAESAKIQIITECCNHILTKLKLIASQQAEKDKLKQQFSELLEYYITQREEMGWTTASVKKEELISHVRRILKNI